MKDAIRRIPSAALALAVIGIAWASAIADEGRIPIYQRTTITQPGTYVLTRDLVHDGGFGDPALIVIDGGPVTLDLNGHSIRGRLPEVQDIDLITVAGGAVTILNGELNGAVQAIVGTASKLTLRNLTIVAGMWGVRITTPNLEIVSCSIAASSSSVVVTGPTTGLIENNYLEGSDPALALQQFHNGIFRNNRIFGQGGGPSCAILGAGNIVDGNTFWSCSGALNVGAGNRITNNSVYGEPGYAIFLAGSGSTIEGNTIGGRVLVQADSNVVAKNKISIGSAAVQISGSGNIIESNQLESAVCGISFTSGTGNAYRNNVTRTMPTGEVCGSTAGQVDGGGNLLLSVAP